MTIEEVLAAEDARCAATIARDLPALGRLLGDDLVWVHSSALVEDKAAFIARIAAASDRYLAIRRSDERVRLYGPTAIVTGVSDMDAEVAGAPKTVRNRFTNVWASGPAGLQLVSCQSTKVP